MTIKKVLIECCAWCPHCEWDDDPGDPHYFCDALGERIEDEDSFLPKCPWETEEEL